MKSLLFLFLILFSLSSFGQYFPRGTNINDGYLPNLDEPDKWILGLDGVYDFQKESSDTAETSYQLTRGNLNLFYGGQVFRGGLQVIHESNRRVQDLSIGLGFTYRRPLFFELGAGTLSRTLANSSDSGTFVNAKVGYYYNWVMDIRYRFRVRIAMAFGYKMLSNQTVTNFYPLLGLEFET